MLTNWCCGFGAAPWECHCFSLSLVFVGLKCAQASRVSVYLSAFTFLLVVFSYFLPHFCFLDKAGIFVGSSIVVPPVFPFFSPCLWLGVKHQHTYSPCLPCPFVIMSSFLLRICVPLCWFPFLFLEGFLWKRFFPFFNFNLCTGCQGVKMYFWVLWLVWMYSL